MNGRRRFPVLSAALGLAATLVALGLPPAAAQAPPGTPSPPEGRRGVPPFAPGELLVRFRPGTTTNERAAVRGRHRLEKIEDLPLPGLELVRARGRPIPELAAEVAREAAVRHAEPNHRWFPAQVPPPNDAEFGELWALHNTGQAPPGGAAGTPGKDIGALAGWEVAADTEEVVVAVLDTGVWTDHPDLQEQIWLNRGELPVPEGPQCTPPPGDPHDCNGDGVFNVRDYEGDARVPEPGVPTPDLVRVVFQDGQDTDGNGFVDDILGWDFFGADNTVFDPLHGDFHGTHVAGTIAATTDNGIGVAGVSRARIMPLKFMGPRGGWTADAIKALDYAIEMGALVTNNSWGGGPQEPNLEAKIAEANQAGQLFVAAAGNHARNIDSQPFFPASYPHANIISVAATTNTDALAPFSNHGATSVDLGAPGASILSTVPRLSKAVLRARTPSTGAVVYHTFGLEGMGSTTDRQALLGAALSWMDVGSSDPILVVDDDGGRSFQAVYQAALTALGYTNVATTTVGSPNPSCSANGPTATAMAAYRAVIWIAGDTFRCTLTSTDQGHIETYVNQHTDASPRNFLLFGQDIGFDLTNGGEQASPFMQDTLRADFVADADFNFRLSAVPGSPYAGVPDIHLDGRSPSASPPGGQRLSSAIAPRSGAVSGLRGADTSWFDGTSMAAPHVTGVVAHLLAKHPALHHLHVRARILERGDPAPELVGKTATGKRLALAGSLIGPAPATDVVATAARAGAIELSWAASPGPNVAGYRVHRGTSGGFIPTPANVISGPGLVPGTSFTDAGTSHGVGYHYVVRAWDASGFESVSSNVASAVADAVAPVNVRIAAPGATYQRAPRFRVAWAGIDSSGVSEYRVQHRSRRWNGAGTGWRLWSRTEEREAAFRGRPGDTHCFRVRATDGVGNTSGWSARRCTTVPLDDGALRRRGRWQVVDGRSGHYLGSFSRSVIPGASLRRPGIRGAVGAALVYTACPRCGRVEVRWNGRRVQRLNLRSAQRRTLRVRRIAAVSGRGVLEVVVLSRNRPVIIEGLGVATRP